MKKTTFTLFTCCLSMTVLSGCQDPASQMPSERELEMKIGKQDEETAATAFKYNENGRGCARLKMARDRYINADSAIDVKRVEEKMLQKMCR